MVWLSGAGGQRRLRLGQLFHSALGICAGYNYTARARAGELDRKRFWEARFTRIYPIYLLSLLLSWGQLETGIPDAHARHVLDGHGADAAAAAGLDSGRGHVPEHAGVDHVGRGLLLRDLSLAGALEDARSACEPHLGKMAGVWVLGMVPGALYMAFNPDGIAHPDRWSYGQWLWALKYTPYAHVSSFVFGVMLANLDRMIRRARPSAAWLGARRVCRESTGFWRWGRWCPTPSFTTAC